MKMRRKKNFKRGIQFSLMVCGASGTGNFIPLNQLLFIRAYFCNLEVEPLSSIPFAGKESCKARTWTMVQMHTSKMALRSNKLLLVCVFCHISVQVRAKAKLLIELELDEEGTRISLTIVDTPGFGDQIDNDARHEQA